LNDLSSAKVVRTLRMRGLKVAVISVATAVCFGVIDQLTGQFIPKIAEELQDWVSPPSLLISFTRPVAIESNNISIKPMPFGDQRSAAVIETTDTYVQIKGASGDFQVQFTRQGRYLPLNITLKRSARVDIDTSDVKWIQKEALIEAQNIIQAPIALPTTGPSLRLTRWVINQSDLDQVALAQTPKSRMIISTALREVGISADDVEGRARILQYWNTLPALRDNNQITLDNSGPWGGAFLTWTSLKADVPAPPLAARYDNWINWGSATPTSLPSPGQIALFKTRVVPGLTGNHLVGIFLRKQPDCTEIISGNIARRVVITCVALPIEALRKAE
jgi:hypothetical protein